MSAYKEIIDSIGIEYSKCTGCGICSLMCPQKCIKMTSNSEGFLYPTVDIQRCVHCGICNRICPLNTDYVGLGQTIAYAAYAKDSQLISHSSSGGVFSVIAEYIIRNNGVVYGAGFDIDYLVEHKRIDSIDNIRTIRGSKYLQSNIIHILPSVKYDLDEGKTVLFSGTPCQIAALKEYLIRDYSNLITVDLICHGVPSPQLWKKYVEELEEKNKTRIKSISFRDKYYGWETFSLFIQFENGKEYRKRLDEDLFMRAFLQNRTLRQSCYTCSYKTRERICDLTLADYWGIQSIENNFFNKDGVSLVLAHSIKAVELLHSISDSIVYQITDANKALDYNVAVDSSVKIPNSRNAFFASISNSHKKNIHRALREFDSEGSIKRFLKLLLHKAEYFFKKKQ